MQTERHIAFSILLKENERLIYKIFRNYLTDQDHDDDLFQEVSLKAWFSFYY